MIFTQVRLRFSIESKERNIGRRGIDPTTTTTTTEAWEREIEIGSSR